MIDIVDEEIEILEIKDKTYIKDKTQNKKSLALSLSNTVSLHQPVDKIVDQYTGADYGKIADVEIGIEPKAHNKEKTLSRSVFLYMIQPKISQQSNGQKTQYKNI
jgi:hypothetical protein